MSPALSEVRKIGTGVQGLDELLHGGIPEGRATLVTGRSGTGKTVLALQVAANLARSGYPVIVVAVEESPDDLRASADAMGLDFSALDADKKLCFADATHFDGSTVLAGEFDLEGLGHRLEALMGQLGARALVLDSATALFSPRPPPQELRGHFFQLVATLRSLGLTSIILAESEQDYGQLTTLGVEDYVCDLTIILRNIVDGSRRRRSLEVNKYRRSAHYKGEYPCAITPKGLSTFPLETSGRKPRLEPKIERFSSGVPGLDEMTCGGWLRNSIIIVRGPTGSGKTLLAGLYARAGAARGERVVFYGFEETEPLLRRNYREIGLDFDPYIDSGQVRLICRYAEATSLEDLLVDVRLELEELTPSLIVFDSISSIEHSSSARGFRQFMIGIASILRQHERTALLTQTVVSPESSADELGAPYLSTIADAILTLDYSTQGYGLNREMRVIKMRGSAHEPHPYRLAIEPGGLAVTRMTAEEARTRRGSQSANNRPIDSSAPVSSRRSRAKQNRI